MLEQGKPHTWSGVPQDPNNNISNHKGGHHQTFQSKSIEEAIVHPSISSHGHNSSGVFGHVHSISLIAHACHCYCDSNQIRSDERRIEIRVNLFISNRTCISVRIAGLTRRSCAVHRVRIVCTQCIDDLSHKCSDTSPQVLNCASYSSFSQEMSHLV
jgi:hypothetical protein